MRKLLKRVIPAPARRALHAVRSQLRIPGLFISDARRYLRYSIVPGKPKTLANARAKMMFHAHSLEKGLSRAEMRPLFGESAISELVRATDLWLRNGGSETDEFYLASCSAVGEYKAKHQALGIDPMPKLVAFDQRVLDNAASTYEAIPATDAIVQSTVEYTGGAPSAPSTDYRDVVARRRSIREYGDGPLDIGLVKDAVQLSLFSPSVCNRQPARVHVYTAPDVVSAALELQGGMAGYAPPARPGGCHI